MHAQSRFEVLTNTEAITCGGWEGALIRLFRVCRELAASMNADIRAGLLPERFCARSNVVRDESLGVSRHDLDSLIKKYPLEIQSPFEGVSTISGGIWSASEVFESDASDALLKLSFRAGTMDLPLHSHDHSDRVIFVAEGSGVFELAVNRDSSRDIRPIEVEAGDALIFSRGTIHTFKVPTRDLVLLSYHSPLISLDDPRQYSVTGE